MSSNKASAAEVYGLMMETWRERALKAEEELLNIKLQYRRVQEVNSALLAALRQRQWVTQPSVTAATTTGHPFKVVAGTRS